MKADSKNAPRRKPNKNKRQRDRHFLTARNKKKKKYSANEAENDRKYLAMQAFSKTFTSRFLTTAVNSIEIRKKIHYYPFIYSLISLFKGIYL